MADFQIVIDTYRNQLEVGKEKLSTFVQKLPEEVENVSSSLTKAQQKISEWINMTMVDSKMQTLDTSAIGVQHNLFRAIMETYMWISLCLLNASLAFLLGSGILQPLIDYFGNKPIVFLLTFFILPATTYLYLRKSEMADEDRRTVILFSTVVCCILAGYLLEWRYLEFYPPPAFVPPLVVGLVAGFSSDSLEAQPRPAYLTVTLAPTMLFFLLFGLATGSFCFPYLLWSLVYCAITIFDFQTKLGRIWTNGIGVSSDEVVTISWFIILEVAFTCAFGTTTPPNKD